MGAPARCPAGLWRLECLGAEPGTLHRTTRATRPGGGAGGTTRTALAACASVTIDACVAGADRVDPEPDSEPDSGVDRAVGAGTRGHGRFRWQRSGAHRARVSHAGITRIRAGPAGLGSGRSAAGRLRARLAKRCTIAIEPRRGAGGLA